MYTMASLKCRVIASQLNTNNRPVAETHDRLGQHFTRMYYELANCVVQSKEMFFSGYPSDSLGYSGEARACSKRIPQGLYQSMGLAYNI